MSESPSTEDDELLEGQRVFNGPRKVKENLLDSDESEDE